MKILLLGAAGQVGHALLGTLAPLGTLVAATRDGRLDGGACEVADLARPDSLPRLIERHAPDVVVNAAAFTHVDLAEAQPELAFQVNAEAPARLAEACAARGARLVHYSTDYVFDGTLDRAYREDDTPAPLGVYGRSKLAGEQAIERAGGDHLVLRTSWVYGARGANFMSTILRRAGELEELRVVDDQTSTPTPGYLVADVTALAVASGVRAGLYHLATSGSATRYALVEALLRAALEVGLLQRAPRLVPVPSSEFPTPARRPAFTPLDNARLAAALGIDLPDWRVALRHAVAGMGTQASR